MVLAVLRERGVDLVGEPQQRELAQRRQIALPKVVGQGGVYAFGGVDVSVREPAAQRLRGDVDKFDLRGAPHDGVRHRFLLLDAGDLRDDVVEALEVLDVDRRNYRDARGEQVLDVLPTLLVLAARSVGVGELVDEHHLGVPGQHGGHVDLGEATASVVDVTRGNDVDAVE